MLSIEHLSVEYRRRGQIVPAVQDVSLSINPGEVVGLVGESGSGKSTIALAILRLIRPQEGRITAGKILFEGKDLLALPEDALRQIRGQKITMIFQDPFTSLNPVLRIREQMREVLAAHHQSDSEDRLREVLEQVQLDAARVLNAYPHQLSGGQRQRVLIATALLGRPQLLLADEPTTALDVLVQKEILELLQKIQKDLHLAVLLISHHLGLVCRYAQRVAVMKSGRLVETASVNDLLSHPKDPYTQTLLQAARALTVAS